MPTEQTNNHSVDRGYTYPGNSCMGHHGACSGASYSIRSYPTGASDLSRRTWALFYKPMRAQLARASYTVSSRSCRVTQAKTWALTPPFWCVGSKQRLHQPSSLHCQSPQTWSHCHHRPYCRAQFPHVTHRHYESISKPPVYSLEVPSTRCLLNSMGSQWLSGLSSPSVTRP